MHREQVEAVVEETLARHLGDPQTLQDIRAILRKTNANLVPEGQPDHGAATANLIQSMFLSHTNLARAVSNLADVLQRLQERIATLESAVVPMQEAIINLQIRVRQLEDTTPPATPPATPTP